MAKIIAIIGNSKIRPSKTTTTVKAAQAAKKAAAAKAVKKAAKAAKAAQAAKEAKAAQEAKAAHAATAVKEIVNTNQSPTDKSVDYDNLKIVQKFGGRHNSEYVYLLENNVIKKKYNPRIPQQVDHFNREIRILNHLKDYKYVTKLLKVDYDNMIMYQSYCGPRPARTPQNLEKIRQRAKELDHVYGVVRREFDGSKVRQIYMGNTGIINKEIYFFDFGGVKWHIEKR